MAAKTSKKTRKKNKGITLIKKANQLIEARYKFDVWETRFFLTVLSHIRREDEDFKLYRIWYKDVIKTFGLKSNQSYDLLREAGKSLMRKTFKVSNVENGFKRETEYHIIRTVNYLAEGQQKQGVEEQEYLDVTVEPEMKPLLLQLQRNFTAYDLRNVIKLGTYPVRVYELLKQYETIGERKLRIDELKRMFELNDEYPLFANFYQRVIKPSIKDINIHTDITITDVGRIKEGRKVVALNFVFESKHVEEVKRIRGEIGQQRLDFPDAEVVDQMGEVTSSASEKDRLFTAYQDVVIQKFGVTPTVFLKLLDNQKEENIKQAVRVTRRAKMNGQIKSNIAGFFVNALVNGYTDPKEEAIKQKEEEKRVQRRRQEVKSEIAAVKEEQAVYINKQIRTITDDDPDITRRAIKALRRNPFVKSIITDKEKELKRKLKLEDYRQDKVLRDMVKGKIVELVPEQFSDMLQKYEEQIVKLEGQLEELVP
jgi:plasmid replication initiation protein